MCHHDGGDDGDEGIAVGQQPVGGLGAPPGLSLRRTDAVQEGGRGRVTPRFLLLHVLLDVVFYDVAVVVALHRGGATGPQVTQREPCTLPTGCFQNSRNQLVEEAEAGSGCSGGLPVLSTDRLNMKMLTRR